MRFRIKLGGPLKEGVADRLVIADQTLKTSARLSWRIYAMITLEECRFFCCKFSQGRKNKVSS